MNWSIVRSAAMTFCLFLALIPLALAVEQPPADHVDELTGMEFMAISGGIFTMGDDSDKYAAPAHEVTVKPFLLGRFEVTFEQYSKFCASTGRLIPFDQGWGMGNRPVIHVSHQDALDFTKWLSNKTDRNFRLPSEAEWEFAARGSSEGRFPWGDELGENNANCAGCGSEWDGRSTAPAGSFPPNGYGLHDMIGNVYEWCLDARHDNYVGAPGDGSAWTENGVRSDMVNRGGSWFQPAEEMTISRRCWDKGERKSHEFGFRVVLEH